MVLITSETGVLKKSKWKDFVAEAGWEWPLKTGSSESVWGEGDISMGCWGKSEKAVDPGEAGCDLCGGGGGHWTVGGWGGAGLTEAKGTGRNWSSRRGQARWSPTASTPDGRFWKPSARGLQWWRPPLPPPPQRNNRHESLRYTVYEALRLMQIQMLTATAAWQGPARLQTALLVSTLPGWGACWPGPQDVLWRPGKPAAALPGSCCVWAVAVRTFVQMWVLLRLWA